jgi:hypothetical protein
LQLLVSDVPVIGWCTKDVAEAAQSLSLLADVSDQLVTDLGLATDPRASIEALTGLMTEMPGLRVRDLEWLRMASWRQLVAEVFESPERRLLIAEIAEVEILHAEAPMQALLFAAWFSSRLGMSVGAGAWSHQDGSFAIQMAGPAGSALSVRVGQDAAGFGRSSGLGGVRIRLQVERDEDRPPGAECAGKMITIARLAHSLVCRCDTEEGLEDAPILKSLGLRNQEDHQLLSSLIDTPALDYDLGGVLRATFNLLSAPGFVI